MVDISSSSDPESIRIAQSQRMAMENRLMRQVESENSFEEWSEEGFEGVSIRNFRTLEEMQKFRPRQKTEREEKTEIHKKIEENKELQDTAAQFQERNPELKLKSLTILLSRMTPNDTPESILTKVLEMYPDYSLADEALEFLLDTTIGSLRENIQIARDALNTHYGREIRAGRNIALQAREFSEQGLGSPTALRDMYRDITGNPREVNQLFDELFSKYTYDKMKTAIEFLLHSLGSDLKAKGPSISRAELQRLVEDTRMLQAILGIYSFFKSRTNLISFQFQHSALVLPSKLNFEILSRQFIALLGEKYISPDKILQLSKTLNISEETAAQIIIFSQMRDAIRQVAPRLYRNSKHKEDLLNAFLETLEDLEDELEDEEEEE